MVGFIFVGLSIFPTELPIPTAFRFGFGHIHRFHGQEGSAGAASSIAVIGADFFICAVLRNAPSSELNNGSKNLKYYHTLL